MAKESSFDIVSKVDLTEVKNAINVAIKEIQNRFDFKGSKSEIKLEDQDIIIISDDEFKLDQVKDVLIGKLIKRDVPTKNLEYGKVEAAASGTVKQKAKLIQGIDQDIAKKINNLIKDQKLKIKSQIQEDQLRVTGKNKDDLQKVIHIIQEADLPLDLQFVNFR